MTCRLKKTIVMLFTIGMTKSFSSVAYFAATTYGEGSYSTDAYEACQSGDTSCQVTVDTGSQPGVPNTGLLQQPLFLVPVILGIAVLIVGIEYSIRRHLRKTRLSQASATQSDEQQ